MSSQDSSEATPVAVSRLVSRRRFLTLSVVTASAVPDELARHDVFLIHAQEAVNDQTLSGLGRLWRDKLREFVAAGGTVVLLEGAHAHGGTYQILAEADLFTARSRVDVTDQTLTVVNASDALAPRVPRTYRGERSTVGFDTQAGGTVVEAAGRPVVLHLVF